MNNADYKYFNLLDTILTKGKWKGNRTGVDCLTIAGFMFEHDMSEGFPLLTSRKLPFKSTKVELEFFIKGLTDKRWLTERGCGYWNGWATPMKVPYGNDVDTKKKLETESDLGPIYGYQWRNFGKVYQPIPIIKTVFDKNILINNNINDSYLGKTFDGKYGKFVVEKVVTPSVKNKSAILQVVFIDTGFRTSVRKDCITKNKVKDWYYPSIAGIACLGKYNKNDLSKEQFENFLSTWKSMINRCYNIKNKNYKYYGGDGISVDDRWLIFENFLEDIKKLENYDKKVSNLREYTIDRIKNDSYQINNCRWSTKKEQSLNRRKRNTFNQKIGFDQLKNIVETLKKNPSDRRMICSAWNPLALNKMALPPCHYSFQVTVIDGYLNLAWNQRSCDVCCGIPQNIASYALLLHLLAKESNLKEGKLIGFLMDTHIYANHIEGAKEQLKQNTFILPEIRTEKFTSIFDWEYKDTELLGYQSSGPIKYEVAI